MSLVKSNLNKDVIFKSFVTKFNVVLKRDLLDVPYSEQTVKVVRDNFLTTFGRVNGLVGRF